MNESCSLHINIASTGKNRGKWTKLEIWYMFQSEYQWKWSNIGQNLRYGIYNPRHISSFVHWLMKVDVVDTLQTQTRFRLRLASGSNPATVKSTRVDKLNAPSKRDRTDWCLSHLLWSRWQDLNLRLLRPERSTLPNWATPRFFN